MRWVVYEVVDRHHSGMIERCKVLGRVNAKHQPAAMLRAFRKFNITTNERQLNITARPDTRKNRK